MFWTLAILWLVYLLVGMAVGKWYWQRRHGLHKKVINGGADVIFSSVLPISLVWPILLFFPNFRDPELCACPNHVRTRAAARREAEAHLQALGEERDSRR